MYCLGLKQYNGVPLDGKPMRIEITGSERELAQNSYPAPFRQIGGGVGQRRGGSDRRGSSRGGRGNGGARGRGSSAPRGAKKENVVAPSKEKLDEEMDAYMSNKA
ncbi:THO complex subunit 4-A [Eurytemora carolleeae]|uniref:THO complex subunit 4-A n=1 Tax=Eurytemora carolleeae TaxID=1294199 RepID=UPI000C774C36|nr:THO complex subunit 4-A [Eurytemora carolleeae]|eukprot:XP_023337752.1 THO complex subunit 4-A-like [Eurytemora affinis]